AIPILHAKRHPDQAVVLGNGQVDNLVRFEKGREDRPALQNHAAQINFSVEFRVGKDHFGSLCQSSSLYAGAMKAAARFVAADVGDDDALRAGVPALPDDLGHNFRICVGGLFRGPVPSDIWLEDDNILTAYETAHAA